MKENMRAVFERLIADFHASDIPDPSPRDLALPKLPVQVRKAFVFTGMRRTGKTWGLYAQMQALLQKGLDKTKLLYVNFDDDRLGSMGADDFQSLLDAYFELHPEFADRTDLHFFFDEIHEVPGWELFIRRLLDQEKAQVYVTGSSARMLSKEIASSLRGRTLVREVFPFSFSEILRYRHIPTPMPLTSKSRGRLAHQARRYLQTGGFPEALALPQALHRSLLQGYMNTVIHRDIEERHQVAHPWLLKELLRHCIQNSASPMSLHKLYQRFRSMGRSVSKDSLYAFMDYFQDAYALYSVPVYSHSLHQRNLLPKKIYCADPGLITAYSIKPETEISSRFENTVFCQLRRRTEDIFYYRTRTGREVDFLAMTPEGEKTLVQACVSFNGPNTWERESVPLVEALKELELKQGTIVTLDEDKEVVIDRKTIRCIPLYRWLL